MGVEVSGLLGLLLLIANIWAIVKTVGSAASTGAKVLWIVVILVLVPIFAPVVQSVGLDPVLVGTIITLQVAIGSATPPFGCDIFTAIAIFKRPYIDVVRGIFPFTVMLLSVSVMLIFFPQIALFLRDLAFR